jgi:hypothetical protein
MADDEPSIQDQINAIRESIKNLSLDQVKKIAPKSPDLNNDGTVTKGEQMIYDFFQKVISDLQHNSIYTILITVIFAGIMLFFSLL